MNYDYDYIKKNYPTLYMYEKPNINKNDYIEKTLLFTGFYIKERSIGLYDDGAIYSPYIEIPSYYFHYEHANFNILNVLVIKLKEPFPTINLYFPHYNYLPFIPKQIVVTCFRNNISIVANEQDITTRRMSGAWSNQTTPFLITINNPNEDFCNNLSNIVSLCNKNITYDNKNNATSIFRCLDLKIIPYTLKELDEIENNAYLKNTGYSKKYYFENILPKLKAEIDEEKAKREAKRKVNEALELARENIKKLNKEIDDRNFARISRARNLTDYIVYLFYSGTKINCSVSCWEFRYICQSSNYNTRSELIKKYLFASCAFDKYLKENSQDSKVIDEITQKSLEDINMGGNDIQRAVYAKGKTILNYFKDIEAIFAKLTDYKLKNYKFETPGLEAHKRIKN